MHTASRSPTCSVLGNTFRKYSIEKYISEILFLRNTFQKYFFWEIHFRNASMWQIHFRNTVIWEIHFRNALIWEIRLKHNFEKHSMPMCIACIAHSLEANSNTLSHMFHIRKYRRKIFRITCQLLFNSWREFYLAYRYSKARVEGKVGHLCVILF